jgi:hypothetical protein
MRIVSTIILTGTIGLGLNVGFGFAKDKAAKMTGQTMTVTGCLKQEPKEKNEYLITGEDGKTWGLKSRTVKLSEHLNHKITVTGKVTKGGHESEAGDLDVSNLQMVSQSCQ